MGYFRTDKRKCIYIIGCFALVIALVILYRYDMKHTFLGVEWISREQVASMKQDHRTEQDNLAGTLYYNGDKIACDDSKKYYLPIQTGNHWDEGMISVENQSCQIYMEDVPKDKTEYLSGEESVHFFLCTEDGYENIQLILTTLPVMSIAFAECPREIALEEGVFFVDFYFYAAGDDTAYPHQVVQCNGKVHKRGKSSADFLKSGLKVNLIDEKGAKCKENLLQLRKDDDWILIPLYVDESKIRDKLCIDLWNDISKDEQVNNCGTQMEYIELIFNGVYYGLYGLAVPIDRKQLKLNDMEQTGDILFRIKGQTFDGEALKTAGTSHEAGAVAVQAPSEVTQETWDSIYDLLYLIYYAEDSVFAQRIGQLVQMDNMADVYIYLNLIYGKDNTIKNLNYCMRRNERGDFSVSIIPWDMDLSLGLLYDEQNQNGSSWRYASEEKMQTQECCCYLTERLYRLNINHFRELVAERYTTLKDEGITEQRICQKIEMLMEKNVSSGCFERDQAAWPDGNHNPDTSVLKNACKVRFDFLDKWCQEKY